jgi:hypothetical protein
MSRTPLSVYRKTHPRNIGPLGSRSCAVCRRSFGIVSKYFSGNKQTDEVFRRTLKSAGAGCRIDDRSLDNTENIEGCLAIDMVVAWRIYHLLKLGREVPDAPCTACFEEAQWKALYILVNKAYVFPDKEPTLREIIRLTASLGGFLGRKGDGEPGTTTLWRGLQRLEDITATYLSLLPFLRAGP